MSCVLSMGYKLVTPDLCIFVCMCTCLNLLPRAGGTRDKMTGSGLDDWIY